MAYRVFINGVIVFILSVSSYGWAMGDIAQGKSKAVTCIACHGANGIAIMPNFPNLAGQKPRYLISSIESYQNGKRNNPTMKAMVSALNKADVENLAAYFSSLPRK
jgi:cytochrome c553